MTTSGHKGQGNKKANEKIRQGLSYHTPELSSETKIGCLKSKIQI